MAKSFQETGILRRAWQNTGSHVVTWAHKSVGSINRYNLAKDIASMALRFPRLQPQIRQALEQSLVLSPGLAVPLTQLKHCHINLVKPEHVIDFVEYVSPILGREYRTTINSEGRIVAEKIIEKKPEVKSVATVQMEARVTSEINLASIVLGILEGSSDALSALDIIAEVEKTRKHRPTLLEVGEALGSLRDRVQKTFAEEPENRKYFICKPDGTPPPSVIVFARSEATGTYVELNEGNRLVNEGKAHRMMDTDGKVFFMRGSYFDQKRDEYAQVLGIGKNPLWAGKADLPALIEKGIVLVGLDNNSSETIFVHAEAQRSFANEIFNNFADHYLRRKYQDRDDVRCIAEFAKIKAAFVADLKHNPRLSVVDRLREAETVAQMSDNPLVLMLSYINSPETLLQLQSSKAISDEEFKTLSGWFHRVAYAGKFQLEFTPGFAYSLQNFWQKLFDIVNDFEVLIVLLSRKANSLKRLVSGGNAISLVRRQEIELVFAPLAEKFGFIRLSNDMRDSVFQAVSPEHYNAAVARMEQAIGMKIDEADSHLAFVARNTCERINEFFRTIPKPFTVSEKHRRKSVYSSAKKANIGREEAVDILGMRFIVKTVEEAYAVSTWLRENLSLAATDEIPEGKEAISDKLLQAGKWRGWRGYFVDPHSQEGTRRIVSIHILTEEMEKLDKWGEDAHPEYKADRASQEVAKEMRLTWRRSQLFDHAPIEEYSADPRHNFEVERDYARKHQRVFVWPLMAQFHPKATPFPKDESMPMLRVSRGETFADLAAFRAFDDFLTKHLNRIELYEIIYDPKQNELVARPIKGNPNVSLLAEVPSINSEKSPSTLLVVLKDGDIIRDDKMAAIITQSKKMRAKLLASLALSQKSREALYEEGLDSPLAKLLSRREVAAEVLRITEFRNLQEIYQGIALGIVDQDLINRAIESLKTQIFVEALDDDFLQVVINTPDRSGLLDLILGHFGDFDITRISSPPQLHSRGIAMAKVIIKMRQKNPSGKSQPNIHQIKMIIESSGSPLMAGGEMQGEVGKRYLQLKIESESDWNILTPLAKIAHDNCAFIVDIDFPDVSDKTNKTGTLTLWLEGDTGLLDITETIIRDEVASKGLQDHVSIKSL